MREGWDARGSELRVALVLIGLVAASCRPTDDGKKSTPPAAPAPLSRGGESTASGDNVGDSKPKPRASARGDSYRWMSLFTEAARAEFRSGEVVIDLGSPDDAKYTWGGWGTGWRDARADRHGSHAVMANAQARLSVFTRTTPRRLALRVRSPRGEQTLEISADGKRIGAVRVGTAWGRYDMEVTAPLVGSTLLTLKKSAEHPLWVDWVWVGAQDGEPRGFDDRRDSLSMDGNRVRRSLVAAPGDSYSFYLPIPKEAHLITDIGATGGKAQFKVVAETADGKRHELFSEAGKSEWHEHVIDLKPLAGQSVRLELSAEGSASLVGWGEPVIATPPPPQKPRTFPTAKNLVVIMLDTTRADAFHPLNPDTRVKTPAYNRWAKESAVFTRAYNNGNWTKPSIATILSGISPMTHKAWEPDSILPARMTLLPEHLKAAGFTTAGFTANYVLNDYFGFEQGWDEFHNWSRTSKGNATELYPAVVKWLKNRPKGRFFLWAHSVEPHTTYGTPYEYIAPYFSGGYRGQFGPSFDTEEMKKVNSGKVVASETDKVWVRALYDAEVTYQDEYMGVLLRALEDEGILDETVVVITNDHGEEVFDRGQVGHGWQLYEEMIQAPLLIRYPQAFGRGPLETIVEHMDLAPTLLDVLGLDPMEDAEGRSFLPRLRGRSRARTPHYAVAAFLNKRRAIRVGRHKLVLDRRSGWKRLFDLVADSKEQIDVRDTQAVAGRMCEIFLSEALESPDKFRRGRGEGQTLDIAADDGQLPPEMRKRLEALGYL